MPFSDLTPQQAQLVAIVAQYPGAYTRSGLAKLLVGAKSCLETSHPDYGRFAQHGRKSLTYLIDTLLQQGYLQLDGHAMLWPKPAADSAAAASPRRSE